MKTVLDYLTLPRFRQKPAHFVGSADLRIIEIWMKAYILASSDGGQKERCVTANGVPIQCLRDYIAVREGDESVGGIADILLRSSEGDGNEALRRFFSYVDGFAQLRILGERRIPVTKDMRGRIASRVYTGDGTPLDWRASVLVLQDISEGLCRVTGEGADGAEVESRFLTCHDPSKKEEAEEWLKELFGADALEPERA